MARRPDDTRGTLIFQEGKKIEGEFYIIAVYDDPASCTISFSAYELENDCTYTYPLTYSEFDGLFKYDSELMNPSNQDGRFHWVIARLDFVQDNNGLKVLCLAQEPTPEEEDDDDLVPEDTAPKGGMAPANMGGKVDAATRVKLLKELDTHDDHKLHVQLVKSEDARKLFLSKLQSQRLLQQEKASQRLLKSDESREARLVKLDILKKQQADKAKELKEKEAANKSTVAQLELMMKQKEAQAIRRLIQEKDEQDRGMGREKDAARQRRKMQERSANEVQAIEQERAKQLSRKRDDQVVKEEQKLIKKNRWFGERTREVHEIAREIEVRRREEKDVIIEELWKEKADIIKDKNAKRERFEALEEVRDKMNMDRDRARAHRERDSLREMRQEAANEKDETQKRRLEMRREYLLQWKIDSSNRALQGREQDRRTAGRERKIQEREELRLRRFRETQFLETANRRTMSPSRLATDMADEMGDNDGGERPDSPSKAEIAQFQKTHEATERKKRQDNRADRLQQEQEKAKKMEMLKGQDPNAKEMLRIMKWREADSLLKDKLVNARAEKELMLEKTAKDAADRRADHEELWTRLEQKRREVSRERERRRIAANVQRIKGLTSGGALPRVLLY